MFSSRLDDPESFAPLLLIAAAPSVCAPRDLLKLSCPKNLSGNWQPSLDVFFEAVIDKVD